MLLPDTVKNTVGAGALVGGNMLSWAYSFDATVWSGGITAIGLSIAGAMWAINQSKVKCYRETEAAKLEAWKANEAAKLAAEIEREAKLAPSIGRQLAAMRIQMEEAVQARKELAERLVKSERKNDEYQQEMHELVIKLTESADDGRESMAKIEQAVSSGPSPSNAALVIAVADTNVIVGSEPTTPTPGPIIKPRH